MAKAAIRLGMTQPAVSDIVAGLEQMFGVRLFDRNPRGVEPTIYGRAILKRGRAAFDELRQGIKDIDFLSDPTAGEIRIGCPASVLGGTLLLAVEHFCKRYPRSFSTSMRSLHPGPISRACAIENMISSWLGLHDR